MVRYVLSAQREGSSGQFSPSGPQAVCRAEGYQPRDIETLYVYLFPGQSSSGLRSLALERFKSQGY